MANKFESLDQAKNHYSGWFIIWHWFQNGGQFSDRKYWMAEMNGEVEDYHFKDTLIRMGLERGEKVVVFRYHRNGQVSAKEILPNKASRRTGGTCGASHHIRLRVSGIATCDRCGNPTSR